AVAPGRTVGPLDPDHSPEPLVGERVELWLEDGSVVALPAHPDLKRQVSYLARNLLPERKHSPREPVRLIFEDGSDVPLGAHAGIESRLVSYLASNILPRRVTRSSRSVL
ncbi:MAG: hypothetical protein M3516_09470, partial [Actinomycetota bacterium]|nr:hypothetical protein [Actinomycetota bacterium]